MLALREWREKKDISVKEVCEKLHLTRVSVWQHETNNRTPNIYLLKEYADLYGCKVDDFFVGE